jgi:photosystem II stability/assembly factor-like uncharacterized protein
MAQQATGGNIRIWVKRGVGPEYDFEYEGCTSKNDIDLAPGDFTPITCESDDVWGGTKVIDIKQAEAGAPNTTFGILWSQAQWLMTQAAICEMTLDFRFGYCDRPDNPDAWDSIFRIENARIQPSTVGVGADLTTKTEVTAQATGTVWMPIYSLVLDGVDVGDTVGLDCVLVIPKAECAGDCGPGYDLCDYVFVASEGEYSDTAEVWKTDDGGSTWHTLDTSPFAAGEDICCMVGDVTGNTMRLVVFRGTTDAGNPAECAITTDWGVTWTPVDIGESPATDGQYVTSAFRRGRKIWVGTDDGYIYYSPDFGSNWTAQHEGAAITNDVRSICMFSDTIGMAVCNSDEGLYTTDGSTWAAIGDVVAGSEPNLEAVWMTTQWIAYAGTSTGYVYYTLDRGVTWTQLQGFGGAAVHDIQFWTPSAGFLIAGETIYRTVDGVTFTAETTPDAAILRDLDLCSANAFWAVGQTSTDLDIAVHGHPTAEVPIF